MTALSLDTIFAPASGPGRAAVCVIRISGPKTRFALETICGSLPPPRRASLRKLTDPITNDVLDHCLVLWMPAPQSFTGEDQAELQIHGGLAVRQAVLRCLAAISGCRLAEAGEFTRRAFINGRVDLTEVEGLADLINSETEAQRRQAMRQMSGATGSIIEGWRHDLLTALAMIEADLDFSDEGDVSGHDLVRIVLPLISSILVTVRQELQKKSGERLREGITIVLAGAPNSGKSTLLNVLARRDVAIVSPTAGTTRDCIEVRLDLSGMPVTIVDTAGLRDSDDAIEQEGISRARKMAEQADLVLWLIAPGDPDQNLPEGPEIIRVATKSDLGNVGPAVDYVISAAAGSGLAQFVEGLTERASALIVGEEAIITRQRHRDLMEDIESSLARACDVLRNSGLPELAAEDIRLATRACGAMSGRVDVEEILDRLFSSFCIGK